MPTSLMEQLQPYLRRKSGSQKYVQVPVALMNDIARALAGTDAKAPADVPESTFPLARIDELRCLRAAALPSPVKAWHTTGYYGIGGMHEEPAIRFLGRRRPENQAFVETAMSLWDDLLTEITRLKTKCGE